MHNIELLSKISVIQWRNQWRGKESYSRLFATSLKNFKLKMQASVLDLAWRDKEAYGRLKVCTF